MCGPFNVGSALTRANTLVSDCEHANDRISEDSWVFCLETNVAQFSASQCFNSLVILFSFMMVL